MELTVIDACHMDIWIIYYTDMGFFLWVSGAITYMGLQIAGHVPYIWIHIDFIYNTIAYMD